MAQRDDEVVDMIDFAALWTNLERARERTDLSRPKLYRRATPNIEVSASTFDNYLNGSSTPAMALGLDLYQRAAYAVNEALVAKGLEPTVPYITIVRPSEPSGHPVNGSYQQTLGLSRINSKRQKGKTPPLLGHLRPTGTD